MRPIILITLTLTLQGCAYTVATTATGIVTGKSLTDRAVSLATDMDCNSIGMVKGEQDYLCEQARNPGTHYNRNGY